MTDLDWATSLRLADTHETRLAYADWLDEAGLPEQAWAQRFLVAANFRSDGSKKKAVWTIPVSVVTRVVIEAVQEIAIGPIPAAKDGDTYTLEYDYTFAAEAGALFLARALRWRKVDADEVLRAVREGAKS